MRVEYINPFVLSAIEILTKVARLEIERGELSLQKSCFPSPEVSVILGIVGQVHGHVIYSMSSETAIEIASRMMMGLETKEFDEVAQSALCEMGNMITANASITLEKEGIGVEISPPTLIRGKEMHLSPKGGPILVVPLRTDAGNIEINVGLGKT